MSMFLKYVSMLFVACHGGVKIPKNEPVKSQTEQMGLKEKPVASKSSDEGSKSAHGQPANSNENSVMSKESITAIDGVDLSDPKALVDLLNKMTPEEIQAFVKKNKQIDLAIPGESLMGKTADFPREFTDDFSIKNRWPVEKNQQSRLAYTDDGYLIENKDPNRSHLTYVPLSIQSGKPWGFEAKIRLVSMNDDANFGLVLGGQANGKMIVFYISPTEKTYFVGMVGSTGLTVIDKGENRVVIQDKENVLRAEYVNGNQQLFINGYIIASWAAPFKLPGSNFGFFVDGRASIIAKYAKIHW